MTAYVTLTSSANTFVATQIAPETEVKVYIRSVNDAEAETEEHLKKRVIIGLPKEWSSPAKNFTLAKLHKITVLNTGEYPYIVSTNGEMDATGTLENISQAILETQSHGVWDQLLILPL